MNALVEILAFLAAWLGLALLVAPFMGGMLKDRAEQQYPFRRRQL